MTMNDFLTLAPALAAGMLLGAVFFGGLWWTVRKGISSKHPASWLLASLLLRTGIVLTGFYGVAHGQWERLAACLLGFAVVRFIVTRLAGPPVTHYHSPSQEAGHAP